VTTEVLAVALALALGLLVGYGVGALRAYRQAARLRSVSSTSSALARIWPDAIPTRSASDILAGRIVVVLGGAPFELPVLPRRRSREWLASLDARFADLANALESADTPEVLRLLSTETDNLYELLFDYAPTILPPRGEIDDFATDAEILRATLEVWSALHPLAVTLVQATSAMTDGDLLEESSSSPSHTGGTFSTSTSV